MPVILEASSTCGHCGTSTALLRRNELQKPPPDAFAFDAVLKTADACEFVMVAAPTELSLEETCDLKRSLDDAGIASRICRLYEADYACFDYAMLPACRSAFA